MAGAGVAGLIVALRLAESGRAVRLVEASPVLGGQVSGLPVASLELDSGAEAFATRGPDIPALLDDLDIGTRVAHPAPLAAWIHGFDGRSRPLPASSLFGIPSRPFSRDVASVVGWAGAARAALEPLLPASDARRAESIGDLVRQRMGTAVLERLVAPVVEGVHSQHPDGVPVTALGAVSDHMARGDTLARAVGRARQDAPAGSLVATLEGGMHTLVSALVAAAESAGVDIVTDTAVSDVSESSATLRATATGTTSTERGRVIVAAPNLVEETPTTVTHLVILVVDAPELATAPRGTGLLVARGGPVRARALTHATAKWPWLRAHADGLEVLRLSYSEPADSQGALSDARALLGSPLEARRLVDSRAVSWMRAGRGVPHLSIPMVGEQVAGTGLAAVISHAERTAKELIA